MSGIAGTSADLVVGIDASTTAVKAIAFDRAGKLAFEARETYPLTRPFPGHVEQDPDDWWAALGRALSRVSAAVGPERIAGLAIGHQRETFTLVDDLGRPLTRAILWVDERSRPQVAQLSAAFGRDRLHRLTGKPPDPTPALYKLAWLRERSPELLRSAHQLLDVGGFLNHRLTGIFATALPSADPLGLLDLERGTWHDELIAAAGLTRAQMPDIVLPGTIVGTVTAAAAAATGLNPGTPVAAGAGDGQLAGLGVGIVDRTTGYLSLGSSMVAGLYGDDYHTSNAYRTLASATGRGFMFETVIRSGMQLVDWAARTVNTGETDTPARLRRLEADAADLPPGADGLMVLPYFAGAMNPHWDGTARGTMLGLRLDHTPAHVYRAVQEGLAFEQGLALEALEDSVGYQADRFIACGGGVKSPLMTRLMPAILGRPLAISPVVEAVALGAAVQTASGLGWHGGGMAACAAAMVAGPERIAVPDAALARAYRERRDIYRDIFAATRSIHQRLSQLDPAS